jgi:DNA-binding transcriptional LysR family regulator
MRFATISTAIVAALQGHGIGLARSLLGRDALADRRLVRVLPATWDMPSVQVEPCQGTTARAGDARVKAVEAGLVAEADRVRQRQGRGV